MFVEFVNAISNETTMINIREIMYFSKSTTDENLTHIWLKSVGSDKSISALESFDSFKQKLKEKEDGI